MWGRKLPYILATMSPVLLLVVLAINGRYFVSPWVTPEYGAEGASQLTAYVPIVRYTFIHHDEISHLELPALDEIKEKWLNLGRQGKLFNIDPISVDDDGSTGARQEIEMSRKILLGSLIRLADRKIKEGEFTSASGYLIDAIEIGTLGKYNSAMSITVGASAQREAIIRFERIREFLPAVQLMRFENAITLMSADPTRVKQFAARFGALSQSSGDLAKNTLPHGEDMKILISNDQALAKQEFSSPEHNLLVQTLHVAYKLELQLSEVKAQYRALAVKSHSESTRHLPVSSG